ncbi:MAG TPA: hypothetical protein VNS32_24600, partial [Flavisolibacter sp.]|nr:hypothetical protein [Flavisolibacter sp.]
MAVTLIADSGSTKAEWCMVGNSEQKGLFTQGISPYFLNTGQIAEIVQNELAAHLNGTKIDYIFYYGTGCSNPENSKS